MNSPNQLSSMQIHEYWHIPRATLGFTSNHNSTTGSGSSHKSHSNPSTMKQNRSKHHHSTHSNRGYYSEEYDSSMDDPDNSRKDKQQNRIFNKKLSEDNNDATTVVQPNNEKINRNNVSESLKRGSHSSQGSTVSNQSSRSASSGSFLLTAANLEQLAKIHQHYQHYDAVVTTDTAASSIHRSSLYNANITLQTTKTSSKDANQTQITMISASDDATNTTTSTTTTVLDPNYLQIKTKDLDAISVASSTHFTMVNGIGGPQRVYKDGICSRGHQITILILTMSLMFLLGIAGAVFMLEMRAKKMPH